MKKSNCIVFAVALVVSIFLLALWYYLGLNRVDSPFDLVLSVCWWIGMALIVAGIVYVERKRQRQIRTIYVSPTALYNSESGIVALHDVSLMEAMRGILGELKYDFSHEDVPDKKTFDYRFVVQTDEYKEGDEEKGKEPTWKGTVTKIDKENGNVETPFEDEQELLKALAA